MSTHSIWSNKPLFVKNGKTKKEYKTFKKGNAAALWTENTDKGYVHAVAQVATGDTYEFILVAIGTGNDEYITGLWDVKLNGTLVCNGCVGKAYGLNQPIGTNYVKIYIVDSICYKELWHFSGYITSRFDF